MSDHPHVDIAALAALARINIPKEEEQSLAREIPAILSFVEEIQKVAAELPDHPEAGAHRNVMREDRDAHEAYAYTEDLLSAAPSREGEYIKVRQVITGGKHAVDKT
jgi:aspartyl/glutamyl-tRNA(Asn/Gln) amidotransferase C subunit